MKKIIAYQSVAILGKANIEEANLAIVNYDPETAIVDLQYQPMLISKIGHLINEGLVLNDSIKVLIETLSNWVNHKDPMRQAVGLRQLDMVYAQIGERKELKELVERAISSKSRDRQIEDEYCRSFYQDIYPKLLVKTLKIKPYRFTLWGQEYAIARGNQNYYAWVPALTFGQWHTARPKIKPRHIDISQVALIQAREAILHLPVENASNYINSRYF